MRKFVSWCWAILGKTPRYTVGYQKLPIMYYPLTEQYVIYDTLEDRRVLLAFNNSQVKLFLQQREPFHPWLF